MSTGSFSAYCALTFKHAVEFSSFGCAPCFGFSGRCLGQLDLLYRASWSAVKPALFGPLFDRFVPCRLGRLVTLRSAVVMCPVLTGATRPTLPSSRPEVKPCGSPPLNLLRSAVGPCWTHTPSAVQILCRWSAPGPAAFSFGSAPVMGSCTRNSCVRLAQKASPTLHGGSQ